MIKKIVWLLIMFATVACASTNSRRTCTRYGADGRGHIVECDSYQFTH